MPIKTTLPGAWFSLELKNIGKGPVAIRAIFGAEVFFQFLMLIDRACQAA